MLKKASFFALALAIAGAISGCGSSRDVQVTGEVQGASTGKIYVQFFEIKDSTQTSVHEVTLDQPGSFDETVSLEGDQVLVRAISDGDGNQACTAGETWGEVQTDVKDDKAKVAITLAAAPCPSN